MPVSYIDTESNKIDLVATTVLAADSLSARVAAIQAAVGAVGGTTHIRLFTGDVYYVDGAQPDDTGAGTTPSTAKRTIGAGIALLSTGDALTIKAGTYTETGLDLNVNACELWFEHGVILQPASGVGLTISGNYCLVQCPQGSVVVDPAGAGVTAVLISGNVCYIHDVRAKCDSVAGLGFDITGNGCVLTNCRCADPTIAAFKIQNDKVLLRQCCTGGNAATIGFWVTNSCDKVRLMECGSQGHTTSGFQVDTGCTNGCIDDCHSGGSDGRWIDADDSAVWSNFHYDDIVHNMMTMNGGTTYNIFQITGTVRLDDIHGTVETQIENAASTLHLEVFSAGGSVDITDAPGTNIQNAVVGSYLIRNEESASAITLASAATPAIVESTNFRDPKVPVDIIADADQTTYVRAVLSAALDTGVIHWSAHWAPMSDTGFVQRV
jgi:hypothetical protein